MKKAMAWYFKWTVIGNGSIALAAYLIGNLIRLGLLGNNKVTRALQWWNDCTVLCMKSMKNVEVE